jgi:TetR/AcrR family transcriptional regulator
LKITLNFQSFGIQINTLWLERILQKLLFMSSINETELAIIEAARKVFISKGYGRTTMEKIASEAKVNKALLHYYYRSKDKLFEIVLTEAIGIIREKLFLIIKSEDNLEVIIKELIDVYVETLINHPYLPNFIVNEISNNPEKVIKILLGDKLSTFTVLKRIVIIRNNLMEGNKEVVNPIDLILNVVSLNVFPFLIRPLITNLFKMDDEQFNSFMNMRKSGLSSFILKAIKP